MYDNSLIFIVTGGGEFDWLTRERLMVISKAIAIVEIHNWAEEFENRYIRLLKLLDPIFFIQKPPSQDRAYVNVSKSRALTDENRFLLTSGPCSCVMRFLKLTPKG